MTDGDQGTKLAALRGGSIGAVIPLVIHVPHASLVIPPETLADFAVPEAVLRTHAARLTDHFTDELFALDGEGVAAVRFPISRLVVDPERFEADEQEPMARVGQGVLYERGPDGSMMRPPLTAARRRELLDRWYHPHHRRLTEATDEALATAGRVLIIDAHSFPDAPLPLDRDQSVPRPDACVGTAGIHTPPWLVEEARRWFTDRDWSVGIDAPYAGSMVPMKHYGTNPAVMSIMIEINRDKYMALDGDTAARSGRFDDARRLVAGLMTRLRERVSAGEEPKDQG